MQGVELVLPTDFIHAPCHSGVPGSHTGSHSFSANVDVTSVSLDPFDSAIGTLDIDTSSSTTLPSSGGPASAYHGVRVDSSSSGACIPDGSAAADIGPATRDAYAAALRGCKTILWTGPMGACEGASFSGGTLAVAQAIAAETTSGATSIVGGVLLPSSSCDLFTLASPLATTKPMHGGPPPPNFICSSLHTDKAGAYG